MDAQYLDGMARTVAEVMGMGSVDRNRVRNALESYWFDKAVDVWNRTDVVDVCDLLGYKEPKLRRIEELAPRILQRAEQNMAFDESLSLPYILRIVREVLNESDRK